MKYIRNMLYLTLPITLFILFGCTRTYPNGDIEEVGFVDATLDIFAGTPNRKNKKEIVKKKLTGDSIQDELVKKENAKIDLKNAEIRKHNKASENDKENPQSGLLGLISAALAAGGYGWMRTIISKRNIELARDLAHEEGIVLRGRIQSVKEGFRDDATLLSKVKTFGSIGADIARDNMKLLAQHEDDIDSFKRDYKEMHIKKNS